MNQFEKIYQAIYQKNSFNKTDVFPSRNLFKSNGKRPNSIAIMGGALGDEGKGRITDELTFNFLKKYKKVIHYRDNGGANAGHTVEIGNTRIALHQLGSGILQKGCTVILGKEMVLHPEDLVSEIKEIEKIAKLKKLPATLYIDENTYLSLDTHRAFETVLKEFSTGSKGSTGRGISPAYADIIYRHALKVKDLYSRNWEEKINKHYQLYSRLIKGFGSNLASLKVPRLTSDPISVGSLQKFSQRLEKSRTFLKPFVIDVIPFLIKNWQANTPIVFEKAQAIGLDKRWGLYPDITASNCGFDGIFSSTEGVIDDTQIALKSATIKATYTSSVGDRILPTRIKSKLADRIRQDANEYGATTKRPRDIAYIDLPMLSYFLKVGRVEYLTLTHLDIAYPDTPIKVCIDYQINRKSVPYRPDQIYLNKVNPVYIDLPTWDGINTRQINSFKKLPKNAQKYLLFLAKALNTKLFMATTGPKRNQTIKFY